MSFFSSALHHPLLFITPRIIKVSCPLLLGFLQYGPEHYSGICAVDDDTTYTHTNTTSKTINECKCRCGCKDKESTKQHCVPLKSKYTTTVRCPCMRSGNKCTDACKCKNCSNPSGARPHTKVTQARKSRRKHFWQRHISKSAIFTTEVGEDLHTGQRTSLEYLTITEIIKHCLKNELGCDHSVVSPFYSAVVGFSKTLNTTLDLGHKTVEQVDTTIREYHHNLVAFETLSITQFGYCCYDSTIKLVYTDELICIKYHIMIQQTKEA